MTAEIAPCENCGEDISTGAVECPECGNNPYKKAKWASIGLMVAGLFMIWLPIVGIPLFLVGLAARVGMYWVDYSPTEYAFG